MKGGRPKPDTLKIASGTLRKARQKKTIKQRGKAPQCPFKAGTIAAKKWIEVIEGLEHFGLIDAIDGTHIEGLCVAYEQAKVADAAIQKEGMWLMGARNTPIKHPAIQISADAWQRVRAYGNDLGLNHLSRQRMNTTKEAPDDDKENKYLA